MAYARKAAGACPTQTPTSTPWEAELKTLRGKSKHLSSKDAFTPGCGALPLQATCPPWPSPVLPAGWLPPLLPEWRRQFRAVPSPPPELLVGDMLRCSHPRSTTLSAPLVRGRGAEFPSALHFRTWLVSPPCTVAIFLVVLPGGLAVTAFAHSTQYARWTPPS